MSREFQRYFDHETDEPLSISFQPHELDFNGIAVETSGVPLLKNEKNGKIYLPEFTRQLIEFFTDRAIKEGEKGIYLSPKNMNRERYDYAKNYNFEYSTIDYKYIPGLVRPWDEGFLTPVFFNIAVLNKYSQHPEYELELFSETYGTIRGKDWYLSFGINKNKKVIAWLGDISRLPKNEIYYLRSENIKSDNEIHSEFYDAQIDVIPSKASSQSSAIKKRQRLNNLVLNQFDFSLYTFDGEIAETLKNIDKPIFWEDKHISPVIESLNRIFVESINTKKIKTYLKNKNSNLDLKSVRGLKLFQLWLNEFTTEKEASKLMCPFFVLYDFRVMSLHLHSNEGKKDKLLSITDRLELQNDEGYEVIYETIINALNSSYQEIIQIIKHGRLN